MKFLGSQVAAMLGDRTMRTNVRALLKYILALSLLIGVYAVLFHIIKARVEGEEHSWITGLYWTLTVMTTLGFGDITFHSDTGRLFSIVVLLSGVLFLLILLPFLFVRLFYAPWIEARLRMRAPRELPPTMKDHVIIVEYDALAISLIERLKADGTPCVVIEPDPTKAARLAGDRVPVLTGDNDSRATYEGLRTEAARVVVANCEDTVNTNITLTVREVAPHAPVIAIVEEDDSDDVLQLAGATWVLPLKRRLGESLATRVDTGRPAAHVIGRFRSLDIAELPARDTPFVGVTVRDTRLREKCGVSVVGLWQRGRLQPALPQTPIPGDSVLVLAGSSEHIASISMGQPTRRDGPALTLVVGAGKVGQAAARALKRMGLRVHVLDRTAAALEPLRPEVDGLFAGDAADRSLLERAGIEQAASVLLTTNDDAMNIYLAVYCRRLEPSIRIVSRITHERNVEAMHRAGADFVLSYTSLGVDAVMSLLEGHEPVVLGEGVRLLTAPVPPSLAGTKLGDSGIGSRTGLSVLAIEQGEQLLTSLTGETILERGAELIMLGSLAQRQTFAKTFDT